MPGHTYDYEYDATYCYPSSTVLINKLNIRDADVLQEAERSITALRILELKQAPPDGKLDFEYYKRLHLHIFQDIYPWAGKTRMVNISKGSRFCLFPYIDAQATALFKNLENESYFSRAAGDVADRLAFYLAELNAVHPFSRGKRQDAAPVY